MKHLVLVLLCASVLSTAPAQTRAVTNYDTITTESHLPNLKLALTHRAPAVVSNDYAILFIHGASFPSALAFAFRMDHTSWMDNLADNGYDVYALDFLGFGNSDRYPEMDTPSETANPKDAPVGRAVDVCKDIAKAVDCIIQRTGRRKVYLIAHSWGGSVAALYSEQNPGKVAKLILFSSITSRQENTAPEKASGAFETLTPEMRIASMKELTPKGQECRLEPEVFSTWGDTWLHSDRLAARYHAKSVRFPSGPTDDVEDMTHGKPYFNPAAITVPVLLIRGEWDQYPNDRDYATLFQALENSPDKKYIVIGKATHVMHLEKSRHQLYAETLHFLQEGRDASTRETNKHAIAVIFEVIPATGHKEEYLDLALALKPELEKIRGFISIERFQSIYHPEKILSLSFWASEAAIAEWRNLEAHRAAQAKGRASIFKDYHLRIAQVVRDYGMYDRTEAPGDSKRYHQ